MGQRPEGPARHAVGVAIDVVRQLFAIGDEQLFCKTRSRQRGSRQYQKQDSQGEFFQVREGPASLLINLSDYLDSGLFLDHRITRGLLAKLAHGRRFLNLFAYTGAGSVHAAFGGAASTLTIDMSRTYLDWARRNMALNGFTGREHGFLKADCVEWLQQASPWEKFGLIFLDPPSFSTSKRMQSVFDVQRDHLRAVANSR